VGKGGEGRDGGAGYAYIEFSGRRRVGWFHLIGAVTGFLQDGRAEPGRVGVSVAVSRSARHLTWTWWWFTVSVWDSLDEFLLGPVDVISREGRGSRAEFLGSHYLFRLRDSGDDVIWILCICVL
jgi:hypothetical protein